MALMLGLGIIIGFGAAMLQDRFCEERTLRAILRGLDGGR
jgi:hypothetical protein